MQRQQFHLFLFSLSYKFIFFISIILLFKRKFLPSESVDKIQRLLFRLLLK